MTCPASGNLKTASKPVLKNPLPRFPRNPKALATALQSRQRQRLPPSNLTAGKEEYAEATPRETARYARTRPEQGLSRTPTSRTGAACRLHPFGSPCEHKLLMVRSRTCIHM